jgi:hypothetical protein
MNFFQLLIFFLTVNASSLCEAVFFFLMQQHFLLQSGQVDCSDKEHTACT